MALSGINAPLAFTGAERVQRALFRALAEFHERKAATFGVLLNHYATQSAFAAEQLNKEWESVLKAARLLKDDVK